MSTKYQINGTEVSNEKYAETLSQWYAEMRDFKQEVIIGAEDTTLAITEES